MSHLLPATKRGKPSGHQRTHPLLLDVAHSNRRRGRNLNAETPLTTARGTLKEDVEELRQPGYKVLRRRASEGVDLRPSFAGFPLCACSPWPKGAAWGHLTLRAPRPTTLMLRRKCDASQQTLQEPLLPPPRPPHHSNSSNSPSCQRPAQGITVKAPLVIPGRATTSSLTEQFLLFSVPTIEDHPPHRPPICGTPPRKDPRPLASAPPSRLRPTSQLLQWTCYSSEPVYKFQP